MRPVSTPLLRASLCLGCVAAACSSAWSHPPATDASGPYPSAERYRPTPLPDRVVLTWSDDPATTIDITYRTHAGVTQTLCEWTPAAEIIGDHRTGAIENASRTQGTNEEFKSDLGVARVHTVRLRDLEPATKHAYRVGDGVNWSEWHHFTTADNKPAPFEFLYFGDAQNSVRALWSRVRREAHAEAPRAAFALHAGDLINRANSDGEWGEWHEAAGWLNATVPTVATPGNHEYAVRFLIPTLTGHWRPQFSFPTNGLKGLEETCYWFDYQGVRFVSLDSNVRQTEQAVWLDALLSEQPKTAWTVLTFHHPIYSAAKSRDNGELRAAWKPIFDKHGVDLVLQGHDHSYARSGAGGPEQAQAARLGGRENAASGAGKRAAHTVYVVSVSGPKSYKPSDSWEVSRIGSGVQLYQVVGIDGDTLRYQAFRATGELYDAFTLKKRSDGSAELIEQAPDTVAIVE